LQYWFVRHPPQEPPALHTWHAPLHAAAQQTPFAQKPLAQSAAAVQEPPLVNLQLPAPSQAFDPPHAVVAFGSGLRTGSGLHVPTLLPTLQA
jgi:hypothetical protein